MRCIIFLLCSLCATVTLADPRTWGTQGLPIRGEAPVYMGASASDPWGPTVIVWVDYETGSGDIYGQLLDVNGAPMWGDSGRLLVGGSPTAESSVNIAVTSDYFLLLWGEGETEWYAREIWAQKFDLNGNPLWPLNGGRGVRVTHANATYPRITSFHLSAGGTVGLVYVDRDAWFESSVTYAQWIMEDGSISWPDGFPLELSDCLLAFSVAFNQDNSLYIAWRNCDQTHSFLAKYSFGGILDWERIFAGNGSALTLMSVMGDPAGGCYVAGYGHWVPEDSLALSMQLFDSNGDPIWPDGPMVVASEWEHPAHLKITPNIDGEDSTGVIVLWSSWTVPPDTTHMLVQKVSPAGERLWEPDGIQLCYDSVEWYAGQPDNLTSDLQGGIVAFIQPGAWNGQTRQLPLFATRISSTGEALWGTPCGIMIEDGSDAPRDPVMAVNANSAVISWTEKFHPSELQSYRLDIATGEFLPPFEGHVWARGLEGTATGPVSVALSGGRAAVLWKDRRDPYSEDQLYFQFINPAGIGQFEAHGRSVTLHDSAASPSIGQYDMCSDGAGGIFAVYSRGQNYLARIRAVHIDSTGARTGDARGVDVFQDLNQMPWAVRCVEDRQGGSFVVWSHRVGEAEISVGIMRINSELQLMWPAPVLLYELDDENVIESVVSSPDSSCIVTWRAGANAVQDLYAAKVGQNAEVVWDRLVSGTYGSQRNSSAVCDSEGNVYVVWSDSRSESDLVAVFGQKYNIQGVPQFANGGLPITPSTHSQLITSLCIDAQSRLFLLWENDYWTQGGDIYAVKLNSELEAQWLADGIPVATGESLQFEVRAVPDEQGGVMCVWTESGADYEGYEIHGKHLDSGGQVADTYWDGERGGVVCDTNRDQYDAALIAGAESNKYYCFWYDGRTANQIYGQYIDGTLSADLSNPVVNELELAQNYPNPFNSETTFIFSLPRAGHATLKIYNLLGQETATVTEGMLSAGRHQLIFDASVLSSGVYIYRLTSGEQTSQRKLLLLK